MQITLKSAERGEFCMSKCFMSTTGAYILKKGLKFRNKMCI